MRPAVLIATALLLVAAQSLAEGWQKLRIAVEGEYPPFSEMTPDGGLKGFDIDIARALCREMGVECELVQQDWDGMIPGLVTGKYDAIVASMAITEERRKQVSFTDKYYNIPRRFVRAKGSEVEITREHLDGKVVGVQRATTNDRYLTENYADAVTIRRYGSYEELFLDMAAGRLDLLLGSVVAVKLGFLDTEQGQGFELVGPELSEPRWFGEGTGIAVRKQDGDLAAKFNEAIRAIRADGIYDDIASRYFDFDIYGEEID